MIRLSLSDVFSEKNRLFEYRYLEVTVKTLEGEWLLLDGIPA